MWAGREAWWGLNWPVTWAVKWAAESLTSTLCQPVLGPDDRVYFVQEGGLWSRGHLDDVPTQVVKRTDLTCLSNLVMDGSGNVYFWGGKRSDSKFKGVLYGFAPDGTPLFPEALLTWSRLRRWRGTFVDDRLPWRSVDRHDPLYALVPRTSSR